MITYTFPENGVTITPTNIEWTFAGFSKNNTITLDITLSSNEMKFSNVFTVEGSAADRSDEAIEVLMMAILEPYKI